VDELILIAVNACLMAGEKILTVRNTSVKTTLKEDKSPVTEADLASQKIILDYLQQSNLPVISEESQNSEYSIRKEYKNYWLVDPLDGTKDFIQGSDGFTVNIAYMHHEYPVAGVVYAPAMQELYFNLAGKEALKLKTNNIQQFDTTNDLLKKSQPVNVFSESTSLRIVASKSHLNDKTKQYIESVKLKAGNIEIVTIGSSLKFCLIAEGKADIYPRFGPTMEWDTAAGQAVAEAAGALVLNAGNNKRLQYNKEILKNPEFIVFRVPALHDQY
jgi:3'(2'), 5'-bisphosphate nucleotidase